MAKTTAREDSISKKQKQQRMSELFPSFHPSFHSLCVLFVSLPRMLLCTTRCHENEEERKKIAKIIIFFRFFFPFAFFLLCAKSAL
jgi:hypothetical protein